MGESNLEHLTHYPEILIPFLFVNTLSHKNKSLVLSVCLLFYNSDSKWPHFWMLACLIMQFHWLWVCWSISFLLLLVFPLSDSTLPLAFVFCCCHCCCCGSLLIFFFCGGGGCCFQRGSGRVRRLWRRGGSWYGDQKRKQETWCEEWVGCEEGLERDGEWLVKKRKRITKRRAERRCRC